VNDSNRLEARLAELRSRGAAGLAPYVTAGDGGLDTTLAVLRALDAGGATCVELGVPFSDPIADGPILQAAATRSLEEGTTLSGILELVARLRAEGSELPVALFSYANPLVRLGWKEAARRSAQVGVDAWLVPDLIPEEAEEMRSAALEAGICPIFFVAPTSAPERIAAAAEASRGFLYVIGRLGVTGGKTELDSSTHEFLEGVRRATDLPLAVGFGLSTAEQVAAVTRHADLAIVGSAYVARLHRAFTDAGRSPEAAAEEAANYLRELARGLDR
jgi:tryptophan synthase alpha chain